MEYGPISMAEAVGAMKDHMEVQNRRIKDLESRVTRLTEALRGLKEQADKYAEKAWALNAREVALKAKAALDDTTPKGEPDGYKGGLLR